MVRTCGCSSWSLAARGGRVRRARTAQDDDGVRAAAGARSSSVVRDGRRRGLPRAADAGARPRARGRDFVSSELLPGATRVVVQERDREALPGTLAGNGYRLMVDVFAEFGPRARVATWRLDIKRVGEPAADRRVGDRRPGAPLVGREPLPAALNPTKQFTARNLKIAAEDLDLTLAEGSVFVADIDRATTAVVLMGRGTLSFHPAPETEKGQVKIFCGSETLETRFDAAFIRLNPDDFDVAARRRRSCGPKPVGSGASCGARRKSSARSRRSRSCIDLGDLSREAWSLLPARAISSPRCARGASTR